MDGNKDEAVRCVGIAEAALVAGDKQRALKFIRIAKRLDHTLPLDALIAACEKLDTPNPPSSSSSSSSSSEQAQQNRAREEPTSSTTSGPSNGDRSYTEDHLKLIREIKRHKDYYAVLGMEKSCSVEEIRKAYRKLSLKVHPDKNKAPGAEEAFKAVSKAFRCLSDEESRRQYDHNGLIDAHEIQHQQSSMHRRRRRATRNDFSDENFDPDEIFKSFFFGSQGDVFRAQRVYRARATVNQQRDHNVQGGGFNFIMWIQGLVILFFLLFAYLPFLEPQHSLQRTCTYRIPKVTEKDGVEYFVRSDEFDHKYPQGSPARDNLENGVLRDYKGILARYCRLEMQRRQWARNYPTPHCDKLRSLGVT